MKILRCCTELIRCLPALETDPAAASDAKIQPHEITHAPDALRYFAIYYSRPAPIEEKHLTRPWTSDMYEDYERASAEEREMLDAKWRR